MRIIFPLNDFPVKDLQPSRRYTVGKIKIRRETTNVSKNITNIYYHKFVLQPIKSSRLVLV